MSGNIQVGDKFESEIEVVGMESTFTSSGTRELATIRVKVGSCLLEYEINTSYLEKAIKKPPKKFLVKVGNKYLQVPLTGADLNPVWDSWSFRDTSNQPVLAQRLFTKAEINTHFPEFIGMVKEAER